jgi:hypothetical protein
MPGGVMSRRCCCQYECPVETDDFERADPEPEWDIVSGDWEILTDGDENNYLSGSGGSAYIRWEASGAAKRRSFYFTVVVQNWAEQAYEVRVNDDKAGNYYKVIFDFTGGTITITLYGPGATGVLGTATYSHDDFTGMELVNLDVCLSRRVFSGNIRDEDSTFGSGERACYIVSNSPSTRLSLVTGGYWVGLGAPSDTCDYDDAYVVETRDTAGKAECPACRCRCDDYIFPMTLTATLSFTGDWAVCGEVEIPLVYNLWDDWPSLAYEDGRWYGKASVTCSPCNDFSGFTVDVSLGCASEEGNYILHVQVWGEDESSWGDRLITVLPGTCNPPYITATWQFEPGPCCIGEECESWLTLEVTE